MFYRSDITFVSNFVKIGRLVELVRNVMAHAQKPDLVFQRNGRVHLNRRGCQFSRLLAVKECESADSNCIDRAPSSSSRLLATHSIRIFPLHFPSRASPCAIRFRTRYNTLLRRKQTYEHHGVFSVGVLVFNSWKARAVRNYK